MTQQTILNATHRALGAKMVDFGGWDMPLNYGSQMRNTTSCAATRACSTSRT